jgi:DNA polymerase (family 10)
MEREANQRVAQRLDEAADLLETQGASPFRVNAYRRAAATVSALPEDLAELVATGGRQALEDLPTIGSGIAASIYEMLTTGRWGQLERLRGTTDPADLFATLPGVGATLAAQIHDTLDVETLEALEVAAHDGRLAAVPGIGARRLRAIQAGLATALGRTRRLRTGTATGAPPASLLLEVDESYRSQSAEGKLRKIAPKRFNPSGEAWLPLMHATRGGWHFTVLYSNTARAHQLGKTGDWFVIYYYDDDHEERQCTVVTETTGRLKGHRVIRGRESECAAHYFPGGQGKAG